MTTYENLESEQSEAAGTEPAWRQAGRAWEHAATDWAHLFESYARDAVEAVFAETGVGPDTALLDVACGSGLALSRAERLGARVCGIDAACGLLDIAGRRCPSAELIGGDMFALPWGDNSFDVVTSFNGIWGGCDDAVAEMARVVRPGGQIGITFWGDSAKLDLKDYFITLGRALPEVAEELIDLARIGDPGVAETMFADAGLDVVRRASTTARFEWPDDDIAWRALRSPGVVVPALEALGDNELRTRVLDAISPFRAADGSYSMSCELTHVIARRPR